MHKRTGLHIRSGTLARHAASLSLMSGPISIRWQVTAFDALTTPELYALLSLRTEVFIVEQACPYQDEDGKDEHAVHVLGWSGETICAYSRLFPPGGYFAEACIGRVVTSPVVRGTGLGRRLMQESIAALYARWGRQAIRISAQEYLKRFYESFGFRQCGGGYLEDDIPHIPMVLDAGTEDGI